MNRQAEVFVRKDYSIIALAEILKRGGDQNKARFGRILSGITLEMLPAALDASVQYPRVSYFLLRFC